MVVYTLEQRWEILRHYFEKDGNVAEHKIIFSDEAHFDLSAYVNKQNCRIWGTENSYEYIEKPTHLKRVTVWGEFWSRGENEQGEAVTVNGDRYRATWNAFFCSQKLKRRILATFGLNRMALLATQSKLHYMFFVLFLKIVLSAAELMSFGTSELWFDTVGLLFVGCRQS